MLGPIISALLRRQRGVTGPSGWADPFAPLPLQAAQRLYQKQISMAQQQPQPPQQPDQPVPIPTNMPIPTNNLRDLMQGMVRAIGGQPMGGGNGNQLNPLVRALMNQPQSPGQQQLTQPFGFGGRLYGIGRPIDWIRRMFGGW